MRRPVSETSGVGAEDIAMMPTIERIGRRVVEIEVGEVTGVGWVAVGVVKEGLAPEIGLRFEARAADPQSAIGRLKGEIEAHFA
jgi:hypothetical protein